MLRRMLFAVILGVVTQPLFGQLQEHRRVISGGGDRVSGTRFVMRGSVGQAGAGRTRNPVRTAAIGFWHRTVGTEDDDVRPEIFLLEPAYPNPANVSATLSFNLTTETRVQVRLYDLLGREILRPADAILPAGRNLVVIPLARIAAGLYVYELRTSTHVEQRSMVVVR